MLEIRNRWQRGKSTVFTVSNSQIYARRKEGFLRLPPATFRTTLVNLETFNADRLSSPKNERTVK